MPSFDENRSQSVHSHSFFGFEVSKQEWISAEPPAEELTVDQLPKMTDELSSFITKFDPRSDETLSFLQINRQLIPVFCERVSANSVYRGREACTSITVHTESELDLDRENDNEFPTTVSNEFGGNELPREERSDLRYEFYRLGRDEPFAVNYKNSNTLAILPANVTLPQVAMLPISDQTVARLLDVKSEFVAEAL